MINQAVTAGYRGLQWFAMIYGGLQNDSYKVLLPPVLLLPAR